MPWSTVSDTLTLGATIAVGLILGWMIGELLLHLLDPDGGE
jgi:hypothetical protein